MQRNCDVCGVSYEAKRPSSKFCTATCRQRHNRGVKPLVKASDGPDGLTVASVRAELEACGRLDGFLGAAALQLAERIDQATAVMGFAALVKELRATMAQATDGVAREQDPIDELKVMRDRIRAS